MTLDRPVEPKDEELIGQAMSIVVANRIPLIIGNYSVPVIQESPYIFVQLPNGTTNRGNILQRFCMPKFTTKYT